MGIKETALALHLKYPKTYISFSRGFTSGHQGVDMAWRSDMGGAYPPVFAPQDGKVITAVDGRGNTWGTSDHGYGNYVAIEHASGVVTLMGHLLKGSICVKVGDKVRIVSGPFAEFIGDITEVYPDKSKLRAMVSIFGRETPVELEYKQIQKL